MIDALVPYVVTASGIALFMGASSMIISILLAAFTGRNDRGRFL